MQEQQRAIMRHARRNHEIAWCTALVVAVFVIGLWGSYAMGIMYPLRAQQVLESLSAQFNLAHSLSPLGLTLFIFANNSLKALAAMLLGIALGIVPLLMIFLNGQLIGLAVAIGQMRVSLAVVATALVPHGIIELPAVLWACGLGVWLGYCAALSLLGGDPFRSHLRFAFSLFIRMVVPLLLVAALVESFITPQLLR